MLNSGANAKLLSRDCQRGVRMILRTCRNLKDRGFWMILEMMMVVITSLPSVCIEDEVTMLMN